MNSFKTVLLSLREHKTVSRYWCFLDVLTKAILLCLAVLHMLGWIYPYYRTFLHFCCKR